MCRRAGRKKERADSALLSDTRVINDFIDKSLTPLRNLHAPPHHLHARALARTASYNYVLHSHSSNANSIHGELHADCEHGIIYTHNISSHQTSVNNPFVGEYCALCSKLECCSCAFLTTFPLCRAQPGTEIRSTTIVLAYKCRCSLFSHTYDVSIRSCARHTLTNGIVYYTQALSNTMTANSLGRANFGQQRDEHTSTGLTRFELAAENRAYYLWFYLLDRQQSSVLQFIRFSKTFHLSMLCNSTDTAT